MKKTIKYLFALVIGSLLLISCEDPYAKQTVATPGGYEQEVLQDTTGFTVVLKTGLSPLTIQASSLSGQLSLLTCTSILTLKDVTASIEYKLEFSNTSDFSAFKSIPITYDGKVNSDVIVSTKEFNDSIKTYNKNASQRTLYMRLLSIIVKNGTRIPFKSATLSLLVTPNNYAPTAINDVASLVMGSSTTIDVLANDTDPEKDALTIVSITTPANGTASIVSGKVLYTPNSGYSGADSFSYTVSDGNGNTTIANVDVTVLAVVPYTAITPKPYYIIGMANGAWSNSAAGLGVSIYPMSVVTGNKYNTSGNGEYTFTGYFWASRGFKLIRDLGNWDEQWGIKNGVFVHNDGGSSDIKVAADGYYTITLNSITNTMTMVPAVISPATYTKVGLIGGFNGWGSDELMTASEATNNHIWYTTYTFATDTELKFRADADWNKNWGVDQFPVGIGTNGGSNIKVKAGTYTVLFNDIDGTYYFK